MGQRSREYGFAYGPVFDGYGLPEQGVEEFVGKIAENFFGGFFFGFGFTVHLESPVSVAESEIRAIEEEVRRFHDRVLRIDRGVEHEFRDASF